MAHRRTTEGMEATHCMDTGRRAAPRPSPGAPPRPSRGAPLRPSAKAAPTAPRHPLTRHPATHEHATHRATHHRATHCATPTTSLLVLTALLGCLALVEGYDPLDPLGNVTVVWDIIGPPNDTYTATLTIQNWHQFKPISNWSLSWTWPGEEYIVAARGAEATVQGDCRLIMREKNINPHCCLKTPTMVDLVPTAQPPVLGCCNGGVIRALLQNPASTSISTSFEIDVAGAKNLSTVLGSIVPPTNLQLGIRGFTCTAPFAVAPANHTTPGRQYVSHSYQTFNYVCTFSKAPSSAPKCCVSFSAFYSPKVIPCPKCSCACGAFSPSSSTCLSSVYDASGTTFLVDGGTDRSVAQQPNSIVCSPDGCPVHIRYHVKANYLGFWRAKVTLFNREFQRNYPQWNLIMQHPNVRNMTQVFSFNSTFLQPFGVNNTAVFFGLPGYNEWLVSASTSQGPGLVNSEFVFGKGDDFTLSRGWPFPGKVVFNGSECSLPSEYPSLPSQASSRRRVTSLYGLAYVCALMVLTVIW